MASLVASRELSVFNQGVRSWFWFTSPLRGPSLYLWAGMTGKAQEQGSEVLTG